MPRKPRNERKDDYATYHIMVRSISEIQLFQKVEDKEKYLKLIQKYMVEFGFKVYAYCLMDNHGHMIINSNGADISKIMQRINFSYSMYFNKKNDRHGHLFQDRFKSKMVKKESYLLTLSAYIHANPMDIKGYDKQPQDYDFSTLGVYLGIKEDPYNIVDEEYILKMYSKDLNKARCEYQNLMLSYKEREGKELDIDVEFENEGSLYINEEVVRGKKYTPEEIMEHVSKKVGINKKELYIKYDKKAVVGRALVTLLMTRFCGFRLKDICNVLGNVTSSRVSNLCSMGVELVLNDKQYGDILDEFIYPTVV